MTHKGGRSQYSSILSLIMSRAQTVSWQHDLTRTNSSLYLVMYSEAAGLAQVICRSRASVSTQLLCRSLLTSCQSRSPDKPLWIWPQCSSTLFQSGARRSHTCSQGLEVDRKLQFCPLLDHSLCLSTARNREAWRKLVLQRRPQSRAQQQPLTCRQTPWLNSELLCPSKKKTQKT